MRLDEKKRKLYLQLFVCIENWFQEVHSSLQLFERHNRDFDEYQLRKNRNQQLIRDNVVNWFSKYSTKKVLFEKCRKICNIDELLMEQEDDLDMYESD